MVVTSKRVTLLLILCLSLLSLALRYPLVEHERCQADSYSMHLLANAIVSRGYAAWTFHPLSYIGYYPFSYPSGSPFLLAEISIQTGLGLESSILITNYALAILFCLAVFCLVRVFVSDARFVLLAVFFAICGSRFVDTTYWDGSARGPVAVIAVLALVALFRVGATKQRVLYGIGAAFCFACLALHHMAVLFLLFGVAYMMATLAGQFLRPRMGTAFRRVATFYFVSSAVAITIASFGLFEYFGKLATTSLQSESLPKIESPILSVLLNMAVAYTIQIGLIAPVAILGIVTVLRDSRLSVEDMYPPMLLLTFIPLLGNQLYVSMVLLPFAAILAVKFLGRQMRRRSRKKAFVLLLSLLIVSAPVLSMWSTDRWNSKSYLPGDTVEVEPTVFNDGIYLGSSLPDAYFISNNFVLQLELAALSGVDQMTSGIPLVLSGDIKSEDVKGNLTLSDTSFPLYPYDPFEYENESNVDLYALVLMRYGVEIVAGSRNPNVKLQEFVASHSNMLVVVDSRWPDRFLNVYGANIESKFVNEVKEALWSETSTSRYLPLESYAVYASQRSTYYLVRVPT